MKILSLILIFFPFFCFSQLIDSADYWRILSQDNIGDAYYYVEYYDQEKIKTEGWLCSESDTSEYVFPILTWYGYRKNGVPESKFHIPLEADSDYVVIHYYKTGEVYEVCKMKQEEYLKQKEEELSDLQEGKSFKGWYNKNFQYHGFYCTRFRKDKTLKNEGMYINNKCNGKWIIYDKHGAVRKERTY